MDTKKFTPEEILDMVSLVEDDDKNKKTRQYLKIDDNKKVEEKTFSFNEGYKLNDEEAFNFIKSLIKEGFKNYENYVYHINFRYDGYCNYNITDGFHSLEDLYLNSFFAEYENKENEIENVITGFDIYYSEKPENAGGTDKPTKQKVNWNNCLYDVLKNYLHNFSFNYPANFKRFLELGPKDKVPVSKIPIIEDKYEINITITGDINYYGCNKYKKTLDIKLIKGHYFKKSKSKKDMIVKPLKYNDELKVYIICKHTGLYYPNEDIPDKAHKVYIKNSLKDALKKGKKYTKKELRTIVYEKLKEKYENTMNDYETLKKEIPEYNLKCFHSLSQCALRIFYDKFINYDIEQIDILEEQWLKKSSLGGLRYAKISENKYKKAYSYDINRFYPWLQTKQINIPLEKPSFKILDKFPKDFLRTGIYRAKVEENENNVLFSYNKFNLYTHISLNQAKFLGLSYELINDGKFNAMIYEGKNANTQRLNKVYLKLYEISKKCKTAKLLMNSVWGKVCQKNIKIETLYFNDDKKEEVHLNYSDNIIKKDYGYEIHKFANTYFKSPYARLMCFLLAKGRFHLSKVLQEYQKDLIYIHTDGWILTKKMDIELSEEMGSIRLDKTLNNCKIINKNKYSHN